MKRFRLLIAAALCVLCIGSSVPAFAATDVLNGACSVKGAGTSSACANNGSDPISGSNGILAKAAHIIAYISGVAAVILLIIGGLMYATSNGDAGKAATARDTIVYALVGLIIVIMAQTIVVFLINRT